MIKVFTSLFSNNIKKEEDDNITIIEDELSQQYLSSLEDKYSKSSSTYSNYISDYDTEVDLDKPIKNKFLNIDGEEKDVFKLKNDFYSNYGFSAYLVVLDKYDKLKKEHIMDFYEDIWNKANELYLLSLHNNKSNCYSMFYIKYDNQKIADIYNMLVNIHIKSIKSKIWIDCCNEYKCNMELLSYH